jgi:nitrogen fixation-related uncharacterized protein
MTLDMLTDIGLFLGLVALGILFWLHVGSGDA